MSNSSSNLLDTAVTAGAAIWLGVKLWQALGRDTNEQTQEGTAIDSSSQRTWPSNLNALLDDIYKRYIQIKTDEFHYYYNIFLVVMEKLDRHMKDVDKYYQKYSARKQFAGSHYDNLRIVKPNEFDFDIIIQMPVNYKEYKPRPELSDIVIEHQSPAYVRLKMGHQFQKLPEREGFDVNKTAHDWMDKDNYLLNSEFNEWFESVVRRALNLFDCDERGVARILIENKFYYITTKKSIYSPARTLVIRDNDSFECNIDLVPALRFPECRWPVSPQYRSMPPDCIERYWMVVPKVNKQNNRGQCDSRSWRIALHDQEKHIMYKCERMKQSIRFLKMLRDSQNMTTHIASYYIKNIYLNEIFKNGQHDWRNNDGELFKRMVKKFHENLSAGEIKYFWREDYNLIGHLHPQLLRQYALQLEPLVNALNYTSDGKQLCKTVARYLLNNTQYREYDSTFVD